MLLNIQLFHHYERYSQLTNGGWLGLGFDFRVVFNQRSGSLLDAGFFNAVILQMMQEFQFYRVGTKL